MKLSIQAEEDDLVHIQVSGKVTQENLGVAGDPLLDLLGAGLYDRKVLFNMADTDFVDSSGVSWLLILHKNFKEGAGCLVLYSIPQMVMNVFRVLNMHLVFRIADNKQEAIRLASGSES